MNFNWRFNRETGNFEYLEWVSPKNPSMLGIEPAAQIWFCIDGERKAEFDRGTLLRPVEASPSFTPLRQLLRAHSPTP